MGVKLCSVMRPTSSSRVKVYDDLFKGFSGLRDVELSVGRVMRKYGESAEEMGMLYDEYGGHSVDDMIAIQIAGEEEVSDYWEGLKKNGGGVVGVCGYLYDRFSPMYRHENYFDEASYIDMLQDVLKEARRFEEC